MSGISHLMMPVEDHKSLQLCSSSSNVFLSSPISLSPLLPSWLYWTNWGDMPYIGRAGMDGRNASAIITTKVDWPRALTIDYTNNKIFFVDAHLSYLE